MQASLGRLEPRLAILAEVVLADRIKGPRAQVLGLLGR